MSLNDWNLQARYTPDHDLPVISDVDVVVVGGGAAGVAAATITAETGHSVALVEKYGFCGGAAVAGMSGTICGMYLATETANRPEQIVSGFTERFRSNLADRGGITAPQIYGKTWTVAHDPLMWRETADHILEEAGVQVLLHTAVTGVLVDTHDTHHGVVVESNAGTGLIRARRTIDASGDAAVVARSGYNYEFGDHGRIQNPTMFFRIANVDTPKFLEHYGTDTICGPDVSSAIIEAREQGLDLPRNHIWIFTTTRPHELMVNATRLTGRDGHMLNVIDPTDFTEAEVLGRQQVRAYHQFIRNNLPGCEDSYVVDTGVEAGIRQTRSIRGRTTLTNDHVAATHKSADCIARSPWPIELHSGDRPKLHWILDDYYEVPYQTLVPERGHYLITAGRCLSAQHEALASCRVTAQCFEYGHAAAQATRISLDTGTDYFDIPGQDVRAAMIDAGSML